MGSTVALEPENYSLDPHIPRLGRNSFISWEGVSEFKENIAISFGKKDPNNRENLLLNMC